MGRAVRQERLASHLASSPRQQVRSSGQDAAAVVAKLCTGANKLICYENVFIAGCLFGICFPSQQA